MKQAYIKIQAVFLTVMVLAVSNSYAITSHFCGTQLMDVSYFGESSSCGMEPLKESCNDEQTIKKSCCKDVVEIIEPEVLDKTVEFKFQKKEFTAVIYFAISYIESFQEKTVEKEVFNDIPPPDIVSDILVLHQTFLI